MTPAAPEVKDGSGSPMDFPERSQSPPPDAAGESEPGLHGKSELSLPGPASLRYVADWLKLKTTSGALSSVFMADMARHHENRSESIFGVLDEIAALEGVHGARATSTKPATQFLRSPLKGLWHKHYRQTSVRSLAVNLRNHWANGRLEELVHMHLQIGQEITEEGIARFVQDMVVGGYEDRSASSQVTGEWIVFARHEGVNYYLALGTHGGDEAVAAKVEACISEFPHLTLASL